MRLSIAVDPELVETARVLAQVRTKREAVDQALREFVERRQLARLAALEGSDIVEIDVSDIQRWRRSAIPGE
jgi:Arc/MetJ family transcription regulator